VIGDTWPTNLDQLRGLEKSVDNKEVLTKFQRVKHVRTKQRHTISTVTTFRVYRTGYSRENLMILKGVLSPAFPSPALSFPLFSSLR